MEATLCLRENSSVFENFTDRWRFLRAEVGDTRLEVRVFLRNSSNYRFFAFFDLKMYTPLV